MAACLATERGIEVNGPVHDAFLIDADRIAAETERVQAAMREASELVLPGFPLKTDAKVVTHPDRYADPRGERMWAEVMGILDDLGGPPATLDTGGPGPSPPASTPHSLISSSL